MVVRCARDRSRPRCSPASERRVVPRRRDLAGARPLVDRPARGLGEHAERGRELAEQVRRRGSGRTTATRLPEPHLLEEHVRRVAPRQVRELVDLDRLDAALQRQQRERQRIGDEPGAAPGRVDRRAAARARVDDAAARVGAEPVPAAEELAARRHDVRARLEQRDDVVEVEDARHVEHAVGAEGADRGAIGRRERRRPAPRRRARPRRRRPSPGRRRRRRRARAPGGGSPRAARGCRCCPVAHWTTR